MASAVTIALTPYDTAWPEAFARESAKIQMALGLTGIAVHHVGSTAVPGLSAKPIIDIVVVVGNSADEHSYVPALEAAGYSFVLREPDWFEHRLMKGVAPAANLHVLSAGCPEISRMLAFRDWLIAHEPDRLLYEHTKQELAARQWQSVDEYASAKGEVVAAIVGRALTQTT